MTASAGVANGKTGTPSITATKVSMVKGKTKTITIKTNVATAKKVTWKSSNKKIASVKTKGELKGTITAAKKGTANITATVSYKKGKKTVFKKLICKVTVKNASAKATDFSFVIEGDGDCIVGVAAVNKSSGLIRNCKAKVDVSVTAPNYPCAAVISGMNEEIIESCEAKGIVEITRTNDFGGIGR